MPQGGETQSTSHKVDWNAHLVIAVNLDAHKLVFQRADIRR